MNTVTIKDIANALDISIATVSRALSNQWDVSEQTRKRVLEKAAELHYKPNLVAKRLSTQRTHLIGIVVPELENSFFPRIIMGAQSILEKADYQLLITQSNESVETEEKNLRMLENNRVDGIILSVTREGANIGLYEEIINAGIPIVFFNRVCWDMDAPKVVINDYHMACAAVEHLIQQGYKRIAHIAGPHQLDITELRMQGYIDTFIKYGLPIRQDYIIHAGILQDKGYTAMKQLLQLQPLPDAVFCVNDPVAIGAMKAIREANLRIPEDIALVGFSESRSACLVEPNLTSVAQPLLDIGQTVAKLIMTKVEQKNSENSTIYLEGKLNIRESSLKRN